jgi:hypothetical protein
VMPDELRSDSAAGAPSTGLSDASTILPMSAPSYRQQVSMSPHILGFWVLVGGCPVPRTLISQLNDQEDGVEVFQMADTLEWYVTGPKEVLGSWLPAECFNRERSASETPVDGVPTNEPGASREDK